MSAISLVEHELAYWDRVWRIEGELGHPVGCFEDHIGDVGGRRVGGYEVGERFSQY